MLQVRGLFAPARFIALGMVVVAACGGPVPTPQPSGSATSSLHSTVPSTPAASPVAEESSGPAADPCLYLPDGTHSTDAILPGSAVRVDVAQLDMRAGPCVAAPELGTLDEGQLLITSSFLQGPVRADGYSWLLVMYPPNLSPSGDLPRLPEHWGPNLTELQGGWIRVAGGSTPLVTPVTARCPTTLDVNNISAMLPAERLACFKKPFVLTGTYGCGGCGGSGGPVGEPHWLADPFEFLQLRVRYSDAYSVYPLGIHFRPSGPVAPKEGSILRVTVHVDDPVAQSCSFVWTMGEYSVVPTRTSIDWCRERLVVDSYTILGTDPNYPG